MNVPLSNIIDNLIYVYILHLFHSILTVPLRGKKTGDLKSRLKHEEE